MSGRIRMAKHNRSKLTPKMLHFARCVASGMTQAASYKEAYNAENMQASTIYEKASLLMKRGDIRARVDTLVSLREQAMIRSTVSDRETVLQALRDWMKTAEPADSAKIRAAELLGRTQGMFKDVTEDVTEHKTTDQLQAELEALVDAAMDSSPDDDIPDPEPVTDSVH
jgi:hypothetical protein